MQFKEVNGKDIGEDLFSIRDKQLEEEKGKNTQTDTQQVQKPKKKRKPRTPKKKN